MVHSLFIIDNFAQSDWHFFDPASSGLKYKQCHTKCSAAGSTVIAQLGAHGPQDPDVSHPDSRKHMHEAQVEPCATKPLPFFRDLVAQIVKDKFPDRAEEVLSGAFRLSEEEVKEVTKELHRIADKKAEVPKLKGTPAVPKATGTKLTTVAQIVAKLNTEKSVGRPEGSPPWFHSFPRDWLERLVAWCDSEAPHGTHPEDPTRWYLPAKREIDRRNQSWIANNCANAAVGKAPPAKAPPVRAPPAKAAAPSPAVIAKPRVLEDDKEGATDPVVRQHPEP